MNSRKKFYLKLKRFISIFGSLLGIVVLASLFWWWITIINLFVTRGHPFFAHERIGRNGVPFKLIKFRSMKYGTDPNLNSSNPNANDSVTGFGKFLRATSLDETIQLLNILKGDMSFIGPRPLINYGVDKITLNIRQENGAALLRPGLSGLAQISGRTAVSAEKKGELDGIYFNNISLWYDFKIFMKSIFSFFKFNNDK